MRLVKAALLGTLLLMLASPALAVVATSGFDNFVYSYTLTPEPGEEIRSFKVYITASEYDASHYYDLVMPDGWMFDVICADGLCAITFWTEGAPLPVGQTTELGYVHYCAPCCHSWYVSDEGTSDLVANVIDDDEQHEEPCNIPAEFADQCGGPGLLMAPIFPNAVPADEANWGKVKAQYR